MAGEEEPDALLDDRFVSWSPTRIGLAREEPPEYVGAGEARLAPLGDESPDDRLELPTGLLHVAVPSGRNGCRR